jgi:hypothetical protein
MSGARQREGLGNVKVTLKPLGKQGGERESRVVQECSGKTARGSLQAGCLPYKQEAWKRGVLWTTHSGEQSGLLQGCFCHPPKQVHCPIQLYASARGWNWGMMASLAQPGVLQLCQVCVLS